MYKFLRKGSFSEEIRNHKHVLALALLLWVFLFMTTVSKTWFYYLRNHLDMEFGFFFLKAFLVWGIAAVFVPGISWLTYRLPLDGGIWPAFRNSLIHLLFCVLFLPLYALIYRSCILIIYFPLSEFGSIFDYQVLIRIIMDLSTIPIFVYGLTMIGVHLRRFYGRFKRRQLKTAELEAELTSANLNVLKNQLRPHFLFNTLHNVNSLIHEDKDAAKKVIQLLKRLFEHSFYQSDLHTVALAKELEFTSIYLEIENTRFSDRLNFQFDIDPATLHALVPSFILQPLAENAVRHGISRKMEMGTVYVTSRKIDGKLQLLVEDDGPGIPDAQLVSEGGIGLSNTRERLRQAYDKHRFQLNHSDHGGLQVFIEIPFSEL